MPNLFDMEQQSTITVFDEEMGNLIISSVDTVNKIVTFSLSPPSNPTRSVNDRSHFSAETLLRARNELLNGLRRKTQSILAPNPTMDSSFYIIDEMENYSIYPAAKDIEMKIRSTEKTIDNTFREIFDMREDTLSKNETYYILIGKDGFVKVIIGDKRFSPRYEIPIFRNTSFAQLDDITLTSVSKKSFIIKEVRKDGIVVYEEA